jgi:hypothetical protein
LKELGHRARRSAGDPLEGGEAGPCARGAYLTGRGEQRRREDRGADREYGTAVEAANWSMLWWARWLIPSESGEALSTDRRVTCSIDGISAAALIAIRCRTPSIPIDPIAMNTVRTPSNASETSRASSRRVGRMSSRSGSPNARRPVSGRERAPRPDLPCKHAADDLAPDAAGRAGHRGGHRVSSR